MVEFVFDSRLDRFTYEHSLYFPNFPLLVFPKDIQDGINELSKKLNWNREFLGSSILTASSLAIGNTRRVRLKLGIENSASMFMCLVGKPGTAKTPAIQFAFKPIREIDKKHYREYKEDLKHYEAYENDPKNNPQCDKPILKKMLYSDYTIESFFENHSNNQRGVCVLYDEIGGWFKNFTRYNASSEQETWLSIWSGESISVNRKTGITFIEEPFSNVIGGIQPGVMDLLAGDGRGSNGFISRFLFCFPSDHDKKVIPEDEVDLTTINKTYSDFINRLLALQYDFNEFGEYTPKVLPLSKDAKQIFYEKNKIITKDINEEAHPAMRDFKDKTFHYFLRFGLVIELMHNPNAIEISGESMHLAEHLFDFYYIKIDSIFEHINNQPVKQDKFFAVYNELVSGNSYGRKYLIEKFNSGAGMSKNSIDRRLNNTKYFTKDSYGSYVKN